MADQKIGKSHKLQRAKRNKHKYDRQWVRTAKNKLKRINYQHRLAGRAIEKGKSFKMNDGTTFYVVA